MLFMVAYLARVVCIVIKSLVLLASALKSQGLLSKNCRYGNPSRNIEASFKALLMKVFLTF